MRSTTPYRAAAVFFVLLYGVAVAADLPVRSWTAASGDTVKARFVRQIGSMIVLKKEDGGKVMIELSRLSSEDRTHIAETQERLRREQAERRERRTAPRSPRLPEPQPRDPRPEYLDELEHEVIKEMNLARTQPAAYAGFIEKSRGRGMSRDRQADVAEAIAFLKEVKPIRPLKPSRGLSLAALSHAKDIGPAGAKGHVGTKGSTMKQRIEAQGRWKGTIGENIAFGIAKPRDIVVELIIDHGVPSRGHRKNIFNKAFGVAGVAIAPHKTFRTCCVMDFAGGFKD